MQTFPSGGDLNLCPEIARESQEGVVGQSRGSLLFPGATVCIATCLLDHLG